MKFEYDLGLDQSHAEEYAYREGWKNTADPVQHDTLFENGHRIHRETWFMEKDGQLRLVVQTQIAGKMSREYTDLS